jgi:hypothetical protein
MEINMVRFEQDLNEVIKDEKDLMLFRNMDELLTYLKTVNKVNTMHQVAKKYRHKDYYIRNLQQIKYNTEKYELLVYDVFNERVFVVDAETTCGIRASIYKKEKFDVRTRLYKETYTVKLIQDYCY